LLLLLLLLPPLLPAPTDACNRRPVCASTRCCVGAIYRTHAL